MLNHNTRKKNAKKEKKAWQNLANAREASFNAKKLLDNDVGNPYHTLKGKFFQNAIKPMIRKAIYGAHAYWLAKYDKDVFVYDDARLKAVDEFTKKFIDDHMAESDGAAYKIEFMHNLRDIVCGMVKEDPFYTSPFWMFINEFVEEFPDGFKMTDAEIYNWEAHHHGKINTDD